MRTPSQQVGQFAYLLVSVLREVLQHRAKALRENLGNLAYLSGPTTNSWDMCSIGQGICSLCETQFPHLQKEEMGQISKILFTVDFPWLYG